MKQFKTLVALVLAMALVLSVTSAFAATIYAGNQTTTAVASGTAVGNGPASITVTLPTAPDGTVANNTYRIYKVFDATTTTVGSGDSATSVISYTPVSGKDTVPNGFTLTRGYVSYSGTSTNGELNATDIAAIQAYIGDSDIVATVTTTASDTSFTVTGLEYGYYFIDTTVGTAVTVDSTNPNATVNDKNEIPPVDKKITGGDADSIDADGKKAIAQVGSDVEFTVSLTIKKGAKNYIFYDKMDSGLAYNSDVKVYTANPAGKTGEALTAIELAAGSGENANYTVTNTAGGTGDYAYTFKVELADAYVAAHENDTLYFVYSAQVTNQALTVDPEHNTAWLDYGRTPGENHTPKKTVEVYAAKITVIKQDGNNAPLAGAKFKLKNASNKYYKLDTVNGKPVVSWVDEADAPEIEAVAVHGDAEHPEKITSYEAVFQGLQDGVYTLIETTIPDGYNKAADQTITIKPATNTDADVFLAANLEQTATVLNQAGQELPSTGGIGTTIFYVIGAVLVLGAAAIIIARRKAEQE